MTDSRSAVRSPGAARTAALQRSDTRQAYVRPGACSVAVNSSMILAMLELTTCVGVQALAGVLAKVFNIHRDGP